MPQFPPPEYYPRLWEFLVLVFYVATLIGIGQLIRMRWSRVGEPVPIPVAISMWFGMFVAYLLLTGVFYTTTAAPRPSIIDPFNPPPRVLDRRLVLLYWCLLFWMLPVAYYTYVLINALAIRVVDRIGPLSGHVDDPSEFAAARKLALRGDVDGAVAQYLSYSENRHAAMLEAARLLRSHDRYEEALELYRQVAADYYENRKIWAEAMYQIAKLEEALGNVEVARDHFHTLLKRAAETPFGQLAMNELAHIRSLSESVAVEEFEEPNGALAERQASSARAGEESKSESDAETVSAQESEAAEEDDLIVVPPQDPFYRRRYGDGPSSSQPASSEAASSESFPQPSSRAKGPTRKKTS